MAPRLQLHNVLLDILGVDNVYFQPPASVQMKYPAIVYNREKIDTKFAGNTPYKLDKRYTVTVIDRDPDSEIPDKIAALPKCVHARHFKADNLNHDVFDLYF